MHKVDNPPQEAGGHIVRHIQESTTPVLCLLAGGSALDIFAYITLDDEAKSRTIFMMGDERGSRERKIGNYTQLVDRYGAEATTSVVDTSMSIGETLDQYSARLSEIIRETIYKNQISSIVSIQGIGADGHTSSIFPMRNDRFQETYEADGPYVPVRMKGLTIDSRASLTPSWLLNNVDLMIGYAIGDTKAAVIRRLLERTEYELHDMPASLLTKHPNSHLYTDVLV